MPRQETLPATQDQLEEIFNTTARHLPRLVPARREDRLPYVGPIPTDATTDPLFWNGQLLRGQEPPASQAPPVQDDCELLAELAQGPPSITFEQADAMLAIARALPNYTILPEVY